MKNVNLFLIRLILIVSSTFILMACSSLNTNNYSDKIVLTAVGYAPIASQKGKTLNHKILNAIKASKIEAYKELAEQIYGVLLTADNTMTDGHLQNDTIKSRVSSGLIRGAAVTKSYHQGAFYITELELKMTVLPAIKRLNTNTKTQKRSVTKTVTNSQMNY